MNSRWRGAALGVVLAWGLAGCGGDDTTTPSLPTPEVSGTYYLSWTLQVLRKSDGFQKEFWCPGRMTLSSSESRGGDVRASQTLSGFVVVDPPCAPESYDLAGRMLAGGKVQITTGGPPPTEGPCPGGRNVFYEGQATPASGRATELSLRGVTEVTCPEFGAHEFTYLIQGGR